MIFDKDLEERPLEDLPEIDLKNQVSTIFTNSRPTPLPTTFTPLPSFSAYSNQWLEYETTLDRQLYRHNADQLHKGIIAFLRHCLACPLEEDSVFKDGNIFCFEAESGNVTQEGLIAALVESNPLLTPWRRKQMEDVVGEYDDLAGVFREIATTVGPAIAQQMVYMLAEVLDRKMKRLRELQECGMDGLLPQMERFWGDDNDEHIIRGTWNVYNEVDYEEVRRVAVTDIEQLASSLYFSKKLRHLTLESVNCDIVEVNLLEKFTGLVTFLAEGLLVSMEGMSQREQELTNFISDLNMTTTPDGAVQGRSTKKIKADEYEL